MKTLLLVAHGSRRPESNDEVRQLCASLKGLNNNYDRIEYAFLELAPPSIPEGLINAIENGAAEIVVMPYFLSAGTHVVNDIPACIEFVRAQHKDTKISLAPYIGLGKGMKDLILSQAAKA